MFGYKCALLKNNDMNRKLTLVIFHLLKKMSKNRLKSYTVVIDRRWLEVLYMTNYHFVGIKGSGMSALAQILHDMNFQVQGSDVEKHFFTQIALEQSGIKILPFQKENIQPGMTIIAGNAFPDTHEEIQEAMKLGSSNYSLSSIS